MREYMSVLGPLLRGARGVGQILDDYGQIPSYREMLDEEGAAGPAEKQA